MWSRRHLADSIGNVFFDKVNPTMFEACVFVCVWLPELKPGAVEESRYCFYLNTLKFAM